MSNPLFSMFGNSQLGNMANMIQQFRKFSQTYQGDPKQQIQELLNSGKITQSQYDQAVQMAKEFQKMLGM